MNFNDIVKPAIVGGIVIIIIEILVGIGAPGIVYGFSIIALLIGGFIAGHMVKGNSQDGLVAGGAAGLVYGIVGLLILYPLVSARFRHSPSTYIVEIIVSIIVAAIGGLVGRYLASNKGSAKSPGRKR
jgi:uncharacterized membrane protein (UPF0136 family)